MVPAKTTTPARAMGLIGDSALALSSSAATFGGQMVFSRRLGSAAQMAG